MWWVILPVSTGSNLETARILDQNLKTQNPTVIVIFNFKMRFDKSPSVCTQERVKHVIRTTHPPMILPTSYRQELSRIAGNDIWPDIEKNKMTQQKQLIWGRKALTEFAASDDDLLLSRTASCTPDCWSSLVQQNQGPDSFKRLGELNRPRNRAGYQVPRKPIIIADFCGKSS